MFKPNQQQGSRDSFRSRDNRGCTSSRKLSSKHENSISSNSSIYGSFVRKTPKLVQKPILECKTPKIYHNHGYRVPLFVPDSNERWNETSEYFPQPNVQWGSQTSIVLDSLDIKAQELKDQYFTRKVPIEKKRPKGFSMAKYKRVNQFLSAISLKSSTAISQLPSAQSIMIPTRSQLPSAQSIITKAAISTGASQLPSKSSFAELHSDTRIDIFRQRLGLKSKTMKQSVSPNERRASHQVLPLTYSTVFNAEASAGTHFIAKPIRRPSSRLKQ